jgi:hypothetical protein
LNTPIWLPLMEYSAKYRVSLSTLRRRIKAGEIEYKFSDGKYLLKDGPLELVNAEAPEAIAPPQQVRPQAAAAVSTPPVANPETQTTISGDQHWQTTQGLLNEIKKAYSLILQEKEEQILQLKEEVADLKTLVRVLESENSRLNNLQPRLDFDLGLEV